jgi:hypothetical protein
MVTSIERVAEAKQIKNRIHFDLEPTDVTRDQELQRLFDLGATQVDDRRLPDGRGWVVLSDPEGTWSIDAYAGGQEVRAL